MRRQPKWIAAVFAVLPALCGIDQTVLAQPTDVPVVRTYHAYDAAKQETTALRLKQQGQVQGVYGALVGADPNAPFIYVIKGTWYPDSNRLAGTFELPPAAQASVEGTVDGSYDTATDSFSITINYTIAGVSRPPEYRSNIRGHTGHLPFLVGVWQWISASSTALLASNPTYSGEFYILRQSDDGTTFNGAVGKLPGFENDVITEGTVTPQGVSFTRSGTSSGGAFHQTWQGQATQNTYSIEGTVAQNTSVRWDGFFSAHW
jgi:hypothetical protein